MVGSYTDSLLSAPVPGNLPSIRKKRQIPGGQPGGGGWAQLELTDALINLYVHVQFMVRATCVLVLLEFVMLSKFFFLSIFKISASP